MNYHGKVIAIMLSDNELKKQGKRHNFYIPCVASSIPNEFIDIDIVTIDDIFSELRSYKETLILLSKYQKEIKNGLKTEPFARVIDDGKVVGIITIADQFIPVNDLMSEDKIDFNEPEEKDLKTIYSSNYLQVDKAIALNKEQDKLRIANVKNIKMETLYYNLFRATFKKLLHDYDNYKVRETVMELVEDNTIDLDDKRKQVEKIIRDLFKNIVAFVKHDKQTIESIYEMQKCFNKNPDSKECNVSLCKKGDTKCLILFPSNNLVNGKNNQKIYYEKLADEIIRYDRIKRYIFDKKMYLSLEKIQYNIGKNEMLIYESELDQTTLNTLKSSEKQKQLRKNIYDMVNPDFKTTQIKTIYNAEDFEA